MGYVRYGSGAPPREASGIVVYAYATHHTRESHNLLASALRAGLPATLVGTKQVWVDWAERMRQYRALAAAHAAAANDVLVLLDAYDVAVTATEASGPSRAAAAPVAARLMATFEDCGADIVASGDMSCVELANCVPPTAWWAAHGGGAEATPYRFVCAGTIMGRAAALLELYDWMLRRGIDDDQRGLGQYMNAFPDRVALDHERRIFWAHTFASETAPPSPPFFTHFAGFRSETKALLHAAYVRDGGPIAITKDPMSGHAKAQESMTYAAVAIIVTLLVLVLVLGFGLAAALRRGRAHAASAAQAAAQAAAQRQRLNNSSPASDDARSVHSRLATPMRPRRGADGQRRP